MRIGILGTGEVGKAIAQFYDKPYTKDLDHNTFPEADGLDVLHVCIPWSKDFIDIVITEIEKNCPNGLVVIHSTIPVGTTEYIVKRTPNDRIVHSPIRGVHPNLHEGIREFVKYVGADSAGAGRIAAEHLMSIGIKTKVFFKSRTSELLKLLDTTYYGLAIAYHNYAEELCDIEGVNFENVMTDANQTYNDGYAALGMPNVIRPVLKRPSSFNREGKIGGHCIVPNAGILKAQYGPDPLLESILRHK